jgi:hypothetical protein
MNMTPWIKICIVAIMILAFAALVERACIAEARIAELETERVLAAQETIHIHERINALEAQPGCWDITIPQP